MARAALKMFSKPLIPFVSRINDEKVVCHAIALCMFYFKSCEGSFVVPRKLAMLTVSEMISRLQRRHIDLEELPYVVYLPVVDGVKLTVVFIVHINVPPNAKSVTGNDDELGAGATNSDDGVRSNGEIGDDFDLIDVTLELLLDGVEGPNDADSAQRFLGGSSGSGVKRLSLLPQLGAQFVDDQKTDEISREQDAIEGKGDFPTRINAESDAAERQRPLEDGHADHAAESVGNLDHRAGDVTDERRRVLGVIPFLILGQQSSKESATQFTHLSHRRQSPKNVLEKGTEEHEGQQTAELG